MDKSGFSSMLPENNLPDRSPTLEEIQTSTPRVIGDPTLTLCEPI